MSDPVTPQERVNVVTQPKEEPMNDTIRGTTGLEVKVGGGVGGAKFLEDAEGEVWIDLDEAIEAGFVRDKAKPETKHEFQPFGRPQGREEFCGVCGQKREAEVHRVVSNPVTEMTVVRNTAPGADYIDPRVVIQELFGDDAVWEDADYEFTISARRKPS